MCNNVRYAVQMQIHPLEGNPSGARISRVKISHLPIC